MNRFYAFSLLFSFCIMLFACNQAKDELSAFDPLPYVNPFIGTGDQGHTFPGATLPFGMVQLSPDTGIGGWERCSGYHYSDSTIFGFSHKHLSGTGIGDLYDILLMPMTGELQFNRGSAQNRTGGYVSAFSHDKEWASPGYYKVHLSDYNIDVELSATERVGFHRYQFPDTAKARHLILDLVHGMNWDTPTKTHLAFVDDKRVVGYRLSKGWASDQRVYFVMDFDTPYRNVIRDEKELSNGPGIKAGFTFDSGTDAIQIKVGLSSVSIENAILNLEAEVPHWNFDQVKTEAEEKWRKELQKIRVESTDKDKLSIFYTALYHSTIAPTLFQDVNQEFTGPNREVQMAEGFEFYTLFSLWDTFRALHPLYTLTQRDKLSDMINSMLLHADQYGALPVWALEGQETNTMIGYHAVSVISEAWKKGIRGFDGDRALQAMIKSATQDKFGIGYLQEYGYVPADLENESVSKTLEYAYDDWCIAEMAKMLGKDSIAQVFSQRALAYKHHFDESTGFMRGKNADGSWVQNFNPLYSSHRDDEYTEGTAWQYTWFVPQDIPGLIQLFGSKQAFSAKLDSLWLQPKVEGEFASPDISGLIGQYAHGNEPSHHIAYLYNYADEPEKTRYWVHQIMNTQYRNAPDGLSGNEDCGQMSAWYILSAMGIYPVNPASGKYDLGIPAFEKVIMPLSNGKQFEVKARNFNPNKYKITEVLLNGKALNRLWISHDEIMDGAKLEFIFEQ
jgi:predicted alpha-1,2-mannosidase